MAPSTVMAILLAIFHVGHAVHEGDQGQPPSPPPDKMTAMSNLLATVKNGPGDSSPEQIILHLKVAMLELTLYSQTLVAQGNSVEAHPDVKEAVAKAGEVSKELVERIEQSLGTEMKLYKMSAAQKMDLDLAWGKINVKTSDPAQCLDLWCHGAKDVMDGLASDGSFAEATGCILVLKFLRRAIQELRTTHDQNPFSIDRTANSQQRSLNIKKRMVRRLADPPVVELGRSPATTTGNIQNDGGFYPGFTSCGVYSILTEGVLHTFQASETGRAIKVETCGSDFDTQIAVFLPDGTCLVISDDDGYCGLQSVAAFPSTPGDTYSILVFGFDPAGYTLTVTEMPVEPICGSSAVSGGISTPGTFDALLPLLGQPPSDAASHNLCNLEVAKDSVIYSFEAAESHIDMTVKADCTPSSLDNNNFGFAILKAHEDCPIVVGQDVACGISESQCFTFPVTAGDQYLVSFADLADAPFTVSLSITSQLAPCPTAVVTAWCENIHPLEYSLSGKKKKKAIEECLKYEAIIGNSALPREIGQKIGLASPGVFILGAGVGLMAMVALTAVALKRRFAASTWVPVPDKE